MKVRRLIRLPHQREEFRGKFNAERFGGPEVDHQFVGRKG
jgi:hypothetical protein